jgi:polyisoprenoid-binding protein YceI
MRALHSLSLALPVVVAASLSACTSSPDGAGATPAATAYRVDAQQSSIHFVSTKSGAPGVVGVSEVSRFSRFGGGMDATGRISLELDLTSVDTGISIRDDRMKSMLFNVGATPKATFAATLDPKLVMAVPANGASDVDVNGMLTLAAQTQPVAAKLRVARMGGGALQVSTRAPIVVDASQFGLKAGVEALREIVGLNFIASSTPVSFTMVLNAQR